MENTTLVSVNDLIQDFLRANTQQAWAAFEIKERCAGLLLVSITEIFKACIKLAENDCITQVGGAELIRRYKIKV